MTFNAQVFRVFIASPSDLAEERDAATEVINDWNAQHAAPEGVVLLPVRWETHARRQSGTRPQQAINDQLVSKCDILLGMFWTRVGTRTGVAESGTIEEFDQFVAASKPALFQNFNLLERLNARENIELPLMYAGVHRRSRQEIANTALRTVGLADRADHLPSQLSGGQQQRVAIARALVCSPKMILADEPTGALDSKSASEIMILFRQLNEFGKTIVVVTHDPQIARHASRVIRFFDGRVL